MISLKGILKYLIYIFIAGWMFLLGIVVGRGTSPITFDTQKFQDRLESIAKTQGEKKPEKKKEVDLEFFGALKHPIPTDDRPGKLKTREILPEKETPEVQSKESIPMKQSLKALTDRRHLLKDKGVQAKKASVPKTKTSSPPKTIETASHSPTVKKETDGTAKEKVTKTKVVYTIQVASYKDIKDAQSQMATLAQKGFSAYKEKTLIKGETWYRIRVGSFLNLNQAKSFKEKLIKNKFQALIIKKEPS